MIKFNITPERFASSCSVLQYMGVVTGSKSIIIGVLPRFIVDDKGEYIIKVKIDEDGDIEVVENADAVLDAMTKITLNRLEELTKELVEAANDIVNPTKETDLKEQSSTATKKPPAG